MGDVVESDKPEPRTLGVQCVLALVDSLGGVVTAAERDQRATQPDDVTRWKRKATPDDARAQRTAPSRVRQ